MRGVINLQVNRRLETDSNKIADKYRKEDNLRLTCIKNDEGKQMFFVESRKLKLPSTKISRDELAFVRIMKYYYGNGDFCVKLWGKGSNKGFRPFWDGFIDKHGRFFRRKQAGFKMSYSLLDRDSEALNTKQFIGMYMKTKQPGKWHNY